MKVSRQPFSSDFSGLISLYPETVRKTGTFKMRVNCLVLDYDGTLSPLSVPRSKSRVPAKTRVVLQRLGRLIPIVILTTKDLSFVTTRTPFAHAWSAVSGLERKIGEAIQERGNYEGNLRSVSSAIEYARSHLTDIGVEIEKKYDVSQRPIAFCVDWRRAKDAQTAVREANEIADYCQGLGLKLSKYEYQPFLDVYPVSIDKGVALEEMLEELGLENGVLYMGDSEADNPAFEKSDISVGVIHERILARALFCDYVVRFEDVSSFLSRLLANRLLFDSGFPMIRVNNREMRRI